MRFCFKREKMKEREEGREEGKEEGQVEGKSEGGREDKGREMVGAGKEASARC